jgi:hypothetical protein
MTAAQKHDLARVRAALAALHAVHVLADLSEIAAAAGTSPEAIRRLLPDPSSFGPNGAPLWDVASLAHMLKQ